MFTKLFKAARRTRNANRGVTVSWKSTETPEPDFVRAATHPEYLTWLCEHPSAATRIALAENTHAPVLLLRRLRQDADPRVRAAVAAHPHTGCAALRQLADDRDVTVRLAVARNPETPAAALVVLAADPEREVVLAALHHPALPLDVLARLASHADTVVRAGVARHDMATETMLLALAVDAAEAVVMAVCLRRRLPDRVRRLLIETAGRDLTAMVRAVQHGMSRDGLVTA